MSRNPRAALALLLITAVAVGVGDSFSDFTKSGKEPMQELVEQIYADFNEKNGTDIQIEKH